MRLDGVLFLEPADFAVLLNQSRKALRATEGDPSVGQGERERGYPARSPRHHL